MRKQRPVTSIPSIGTGSRALLMDPLKLSTLIIKRITELGTVTYNELQERALEKGIELGIFENAISRVHKKKTVLVKNVKGVLTYSIKPVVVKKTGMEVLDEWRRANPYPKMDGTNDCHHEIFNGIDLSFLFLTPDELAEYKNNGRQVFKKEKYEYVN